MSSTGSDSTAASKTSTGGASPSRGNSRCASGPNGAVSIAAATSSLTSPGFVLDAKPIRPSTITRSATPLVCLALISFSRFASNRTGVSSDSTAKTSACWAPALSAAWRTVERSVKTTSLPAPLSSRSRYSSLSHHAILNPDVRTPVRDRQRHLARLAAASALVEVHVVPQRIDVHERRKQVPGQLYRPQHFRDLPVADHVRFARREREHLHACRPAEPVPRVDPLIDVRDQILE